MGYTGKDCSKEVDWCQEKTIEVDGHPIVLSVCGDRGECVSTWAGAKCICYPGFTGQFCDQLIPDELFLSKRCLAYNESFDHDHWSPYDQVGCSGKQECVPDDLQCLLTPCNNPIGWCLPSEKALNRSSIFFDMEPDYHSFWSHDAKNTGACSGHGECQCDSGYTGDECEKEVDWCNQPTQGIDPTAPIKKVCGDNGTCISHPAGASCICEPGFTGQFCHEIIPTEVFIARRCFSKEPKLPWTTTQSVPVGCEDGLSCIPENIQCLVPGITCNNPIGWCLPMAPVDSFMNFIRQIPASHFEMTE
jgi:Notch-like protein